MAHSKARSNFRVAISAVTEGISAKLSNGIADIEQLRSLTRSEEWNTGKEKLRSIRINSTDKQYRLKALCIDVLLRYIEALTGYVLHTENAPSRDEQDRQGFSVFLDVCQVLCSDVFSSPRGAKNHFDFDSYFFSWPTVKDFVDVVTKGKREVITNAGQEVFKMFFMCYASLGRNTPAAPTDASGLSDVITMLFPEALQRKSFDEFIAWVYDWELRLDLSDGDTFSAFVAAAYLEDRGQKVTTRADIDIICHDAVPIDCAESRTLAGDCGIRTLLPDRGRYTNQVVIVGEVKNAEKGGERCIFACTLEWVPSLKSVCGVKHMSYHPGTDKKADRLTEGISRMIACNMPDNTTNDLTRIFAFNSSRICTYALGYSPKTGAMKNVPVSSVCTDVVLITGSTSLFRIEGKLYGACDYTDKEHSAVIINELYCDGQDNTCQTVATIRGASARKTGGAVMNGKRIFFSTYEQGLKLKVEGNDAVDIELGFRPQAVAATKKTLIVLKNDGVVMQYSINSGEKLTIDSSVHATSTQVCKLDHSNVTDAKIVLADEDVLVLLADDGHANFETVELHSVASH